MHFFPRPLQHYQVFLRMRWGAALAKTSQSNPRLGQIRSGIALHGECKQRFESLACEYSNFSMGRRLTCSGTRAGPSQISSHPVPNLRPETLDALHDTFERLVDAEGPALEGEWPASQPRLAKHTLEGPQGLLPVPKLSLDKANFIVPKRIQQRACLRCHQSPSRTFLR